MIPVLCIWGLVSIALVDGAKWSITAAMAMAGAIAVFAAILDRIASAIERK